MRRIALAVGLCVLASICIVPAQQGPTQSGSETVAKPRKKEPDAEKAKIPSEYKKDRPDLPSGVPTFKADVTTVTLDVAIVDNKGHFLANIPKEKFRVLEDNVPQQISTFAMGEAPMTVALVIEFSNRFQQYWSETWYQTLTASYGFLQTLKPEDYAAIIAFDIRPEILSDFSTDRRQAYEAMQRLRIAGFSESNLYDALTDTADRMSNIEGRKAIVVIASGMDTFSKITFDQCRKSLQTSGVPIYSIGLMQALREWYDSRGLLGSIARLDFLQADNALRTFTKETGGQAFFPRFYGEFPSIFNSISLSLRNQYSMTYQPSNQAKDGKYRKIKVELVDPATNDKLSLQDEKGKPLKYTVIARNGYTAPREVE
jgi:VWFA-related protein